MSSPSPNTPADALATRFEAHRLHMRGTAYRLLGSLAEADDVVQDAWFRTVIALPEEETLIEPIPFASTAPAVRVTLMCSTKLACAAISI